MKARYHGKYEKVIRISLKQGFEIPLSPLQQELIDLIGEVLNENPPKMYLTKLVEGVKSKLPQHIYGLNSKINYCLLVLFIKKEVKLKSWKKARERYWKLWIWLPKYSKQVHFQVTAKKKKESEYENIEI